MRKHLAHSTKLYAQHLAAIDQAAADLYRQRKADDDHATVLAATTPTPTVNTPKPESE